MAGHAPELLSAGERLTRWFADVSDLRLSVYMILLAVAIVATVLLIDWTLLT